MLRVFFALNVFLLSLLACNGGYKACTAKITSLNVLQNQEIVIPLKDNQKLIYSTKMPNAKIIKHNPFLNLYLVENKKFVRYPFRINNSISKGMASVDNKKVINGKLKKNQIGLNTLATYNKVVSAPSLLLGSCCNLEGLVTPYGIIQKEYLDNFIHSKNKTYSDIGVRVVDEGKLIIINRVDPFDKSIKFKKNDCITHLNGKRVKNASRFMMAILFSKFGTKFDVKIIRDGKKMSIKTTTSQRFGGGFISDTFLEQNGLYFSNNLTIISVGKKYTKYGLRTGDRLIQVNGKKVKTITDIRNNIDDFKFYASLLFTRNKFQFFVNINP